MLATPTRERTRSALPSDVFEKFISNNPLGGRAGTWHTLRAYFIPHPKRGNDLIVIFTDTVKDHQALAALSREFKASAGLDGWENAAEYYKELRAIEAEHTMGDIHLFVPDKPRGATGRTRVPDETGIGYSVVFSIYMRPASSPRPDQLTHPERVRGDEVLDKTIDLLTEAYRSVRQR